MSMMQSKTHSQLSKTLGLMANLSAPQIEVINDLLGAIIEGETDFHPDNQARQSLAWHEITTANLTAQECAAELDKMEIEVRYVRFESGADRGLEGLETSRVWTEKGLKHALARERFINSIQFDGSEHNEMANG